MFKLCKELRRVQNAIPMRMDGKPDLEGFLDPHMLNVVAPEYFLCGISKCMIEISILSGCGQKEPGTLGSMVWWNLRRMGMRTQQLLLYKTKNVQRCLNRYTIFQNRIISYHCSGTEDQD